MFEQVSHATLTEEQAVQLPLLTKKVTAQVRAKVELEQVSQEGAILLHGVHLNVSK